MKRNIKNFLVKAFSMCLAFILVFPTNLFAMGLDNTKTRKYNASASIMGLAQTDNTGQSDDKITDQTLLETEITSKETDKYLIEKYARLFKTTGQIEYLIKVHPKDEESKNKITTSFAISKNTDLKDLKIEKVSQIHSDDSQAEIKYQEQRPSILYNNDAFETLGVTTDKADLVYYLSAKLSEEALAKIDEKTPSMDLDINIAEAGANTYQDRYALSIDKMEVVGEDGEDTIETLKEKENPTHQINAIYKEGSSNLLVEITGEITWTDFIHADDDKEFTTDIKLDEAQDATDSQIKVEFYQANEKGYILKEDFTKEIPFTQSLKLQIPLGFIAKVELKTKASGNAKEYSLNQTKIPNPIYKEEKTEEKSEEDDADPLPEERSEESKGTSEEKIIPIDPETNEAVIDHSLVSEDDTEETKSAINLNRDSVINNFKNNEKLNPVVEITINNISSLFNAYNNDEMTYEEFLANLKTQAKDLSKEDFAAIVKGLIAGLNQETYKVANIDEDQLLAEIYGKDEAEEQATEEKPVTETKEADTEETSNVENGNVDTETKEYFRTPEEKVKDDALKSFDETLAQAKENSKKPQEDDRDIFANLSEGIKGIFGQSNLQKADQELKAALAAGQSLEEIQALLQDLDKKYQLNSKDEARLMADNEDAIKGLIARDADQNFNPSMLMAKANANANTLDSKKFTIRTRFDTSTAIGDIQAEQFFKIHLDEKLTVKEGTKLDPITYNGEVIATPKYNGGDNTITYTITKNIGKNIQVPLEIPVDYNTEKIPAGEDFTVVNKISGLGVTDPKELPPEKIDKNGNPAGTIIEPDRKDVIEIIEPDDKNYKFNLDANASPVVENAELVGYNWTIRVTSDTDLSSLGYKANFTTVDGSGLGEITSKNINLEDNPIKGNFGIVDSKHHNLTSSAYEITYNLFTPAKDKQSSYMLDISVVLVNEGEVGAERIVAEEGYSDDIIEKTSPTRVSMNNRTSIKGEFASNKSAKWTITDAVSTGDTNNGLPLVKRELGNQTFASGRTATYGLNDSGKMVVKANESTLNKLPSAEENPAGKQAVGNIAVYEIDTNLNSPDAVKEYSVSGVRISKYRNIPLEQTWGFPESYENMPAQEISVTDKAGKPLGETISVGPSTGHTRTINIPNVKYWDIANDGTATMIDHKVVQTFPEGNVQIGNKTYKYDELANYYHQNLRAHYLYNKLNEVTNKTPATFTVIKIDSKDGSKRLAGAKYYLNGAEVEITTDANGVATFKNIQPGSYTLVETKAPDGYKLDQDRKYITVSDDGMVSVVGNNAHYSSGSGKTELVEHSNYPSYPDFMNAQHYGKINENGDVEFYLYLKPYDKRGDGRTDKDTTLNISLPGVNLTNSNVTVYDVNPNQRQSVFDAMNNQNVENKIPDLGNDLKNITTSGTDTIEGRASVTNPLSGNTGYQLTFPTTRFGDNWGFLVKVTGNIGSKDNTILSYDWLAKNNPGGEARIRQKVNLTKNTGESQQTITITNEEYKKSNIEIAKFDTEKKRLAGAEFEVKDSDGRVLRDVTADEKGNANFGKYPPGTYYLEESKAPVGYEKSNVYFVVTVDEQGQVSYQAKFKNSDSIPTVGTDYYIERTEGGVDENPVQVNNIKQNMWINDAEGRGYYQNVWEAYRLESLMWTLDADLSNVSPGKTLEIQFDQNLDFTQYFNNFPNMESKGKVIAEPHFDYKTNLLTYVFNDKSLSEANTHVHLELKGMIPSKFYQLDTSTKEFTNVVAPGKTVTGNQTQTISVRAYYEGHDNHVSWPYDPNKTNAEYPTQSYYFRDVYKGDDGKWYVKAMAYYNPLGNYNYKLNKQNNIYFNWIFTDWSEAPQPKWVGKYNIPYELKDVKIYRTDFPGTEKVFPKEGNKDVYSYINKNMPLSYGIVPENDPNTYELVYSSPIDPKSAKTNTQGNITLKYNPNNLNPTGSIINVNNPPLELTMPTISAKQEGYVIEQTFSITDIDEFYRHWRAFSMVNGPRNKVSLKSTFVVGPNKNFAKADQVGVDLPETFKEVVGIINKRYEPARFTITKVNGDTQAKLEGASFILTDEDGNSIIRTSDKNGLVEFKDLAPGRYTLKEYKAPEKFKATKEEWQVTVYSNGYVKIESTSVTGGGSSHTGENINITVENKPTGEDFRIYKKDDEGKGLAGAEFTLTKPGETKPTKTATSNSNGLVSFDGLTDGVYVIEETKAPDGYKKLNKKWVLEVKKGKKEVYTYSLSGTNIKSILGEEGTYWVNVKERPTSGWNKYDNRFTGWTGLSNEARYLGTRIVAINKDKKYVIQRYVINPEARDIGATTAIIHRELPEYPNMDWYEGDEVIKAFTLDPKEDGNKDGKVHGLISDLRLADYETKEITISKEVDTSRFGQRRLRINLPATKKPIVVDVKVPYKDINGGVGTGMDWYEGGQTFWKSDYYESVSDIIADDPITREAGSIIGSYIAEGSLDVTNQAKTYGFKIKKVKEGATNTPVPGAKFKLTGGNLPEEGITVSSNDKGLVEFTGLKPGQYTLEETEPAPGYEKTDQKWQVTITNEGKAYIKADSTESTSSTNRLALRRLQSSKANDGLEIGDQLVDTDNPQAAGISKIDYEIKNLKNAERFKNQVEVTSNVEYLGNDEFKVRYDMKNITGSTLTNKQFSVFFNNDATFVGGSTHTWKWSMDGQDGDPNNPNNISRWHSGYDTNSKIIGIKNNELTIPAGDTASIEFKVQVRSNLGINGEVNLVGYIRYDNSNITAYPRVRKLQRYKISYDAKGGTIITDPMDWSVNGPLVEIKEVTPKAGYTKTAGPTVTNNETGRQITIRSDNKFPMPDSDVTISAQFEANSYKVNKGKIENGSISIPDSAKTDKVVNITDIRPNDGYKLGEITVTDSNGKSVEVTNNTFKMPAGEVTVNATFVKKAYKITKQNPTNGDFEVPATAEAGSPVTITLKPDIGYEKDTISVRDGNGEVKVTGNTFTMPESDVVVEVTFKKIPPNVFNITVNQAQNGSVSANKASAKENEEVILTVSPAKGYELDQLLVDGKPVIVTDGKYKFNMPKSNVKVSATFKKKTITPPEDSEEIPDTGYEITNRQTGLNLKIFKKDNGGYSLKDAEFTLVKYTDKTYGTKDDNFEVITVKSDENGKVNLVDKDKNPISLEPGFYRLTETKAPLGYKQAQAPWDIEVYEEGGQLKAKYKSALYSDDKYIKQKESYASDQLMTAPNGIKYKSKITSINTETKTYVQRIYIDTRAYRNSDKVNVQIVPKYKREEIDIPGVSPATYKEGVKTAYRSTYKITGGPTSTDENAFANNVLENYDLSKNNVTMVNTAKWRPFDWGFDEDIMNLDAGGIYYIDVEGFYDEAILDGTAENEAKIDEKFNLLGDDGNPINPYSESPALRPSHKRDDIKPEDYKKLNLYIDFYDGARSFQQVKDPNATGNDRYTDGSDLSDSYLDGNVVLGYVKEINGKTDATKSGKIKDPGEKYPNWLSKKGGRIYPSIGDKVSKTRVKTSVDLSSLYIPDQFKVVPNEGMTVLNDKETYNITFTKHGRDNEKQDINGEEVTKNRLEGAVFRLEKDLGSGTFVPVEGSYVGSAFNGFFGFRGLEPGRYRLIEVKAPEGYNPIKDPLLYFTIKTVNANSGEVVNPENGRTIDIKDANIRFTSKTGTVYRLGDLEMVNPKDPNTNIAISKVDSKEIDIETAQILNKDNGNQPVALKDLIVVGEEKYDEKGNAYRNEYPVSQIKIIPKSSGYISLEYDKANGVYQYVPGSAKTEKDGKLIDFVTSATAKNMGKIINEKPGEGKVTIKKVDSNNELIKASDLTPGAVFKLTRVTLKADGTMADDSIRTETIGKDGTLTFKNLPIGTYRLTEIKSPDGYMNTDQIWYFTVGGEGLDPYAGPIARTGRNLSDKITLKTEKMTVINPDKKTNLVKKELHPHFGESMEFTNKFTIDENTKINPGDYFVLHMSDQIDINGIFEREITNLDIIADGVGTIAKADYDRANRTITYTFTDYAKTYELIDFSNKLTAFIDLYKVKNSDTSQSVGFRVGKDTSNYKDIKVIYDLDYGWQFDALGNGINLVSKIVKYNPATGEFLHYFYINRLKYNSDVPIEWRYRSDQDIENLNISYAYLVNNSDSNIAKDMPESFGVNERSNNLYQFTTIRAYDYLAHNYYSSFRFTNGLGQNESVIIKVTGKVAGIDKSEYVAYGDMYEYTPGYTASHAHRHDAIRYFENEAEARVKLGIKAVNHENMIKFKKVDQDDKALAGARFQLQIETVKDGSKAWENIGDEITTKDDGIVEYKKLKPGKYQLIETKAPDGYKIAQGPVETFEVNDNGKIIRKETLPGPVGPGQTEQAIEETGKTPIPIVNKKEENIDFTKVDAENKTKKLEGAEFEVWYKANEADKNYTKLKVYEKTADGKTDRIVLKAGDDVPEGYTEAKDDKIISGTDGKLGFKFYDPGYYALKETRAPKGYGMPRGYVYEYRLVDGKVEEKKIDTEGNVTYEAKANNDSIEIENQKSTFPLTGGNGVFIGFAIIGTAVMLTALAYFGIYQNDKNRRRSARYKK